MPLTAQEKLFVEAYCGEANFDPKKARTIAGYDPSERKGRGLAMLKRPEIATAVDERTKTRMMTSWYKEEEILRMLMTEATREGKGATHSGRIQAIIHLGKHIGMFRDKVEEKVQDNSTTVFLVNYGDDKPIKNAVEKLVEQNIEEITPALEGVYIEDFSDGSKVQE